MGLGTTLGPVKSVSSPKLTEIVTDVLRREILTGKIRQGDNLPLEQDLAVQLGVSRPTLREALRVLESESLIRPRRGSREGAVVIAPTIDSAARYFGYLLQYSDTTLEDLARARLMLEPPLVALLAREHNDEDMAVLRAALDRERVALEESGEFRFAQVMFHELACTMAGVETMSIFIRQLNWVLRGLVDEHRAPQGNYNQSEAAEAHKAHARLVELVDAGESEKTLQFWHDHVCEIDKRLLYGQEGKRVVDLYS
jgi:DNA-binding FadR family transcriptional regulator